MAPTLSNNQAFNRSIQQLYSFYTLLQQTHSSETVLLYHSSQLHLCLHNLHSIATWIQNVIIVLHVIIHSHLTVRNILNHSTHYCYFYPNFSTTLSECFRLRRLHTKLLFIHWFNFFSSLSTPRSLKHSIKLLYSRLY